MTVLFNNIAFAPKLIIGLAGLANILTQLEQEVGKVRGQGISPRLKKLLRKLNFALKGTSNDEVRKRVFTMANKAHLEGKTKLAYLLIFTVHRKVSGHKAAVLRKNFYFAKSLLEGTPYNHGRIGQDGRLVLRKDLRMRRQKEGLAVDTILGLNCMTMNNLFVNLLIGAEKYTTYLADPNQKGEVKKGTTNEDIFTKKELVEEGLYSYPVINHFPASRLNSLSGLLNLYGNFFAAQIYCKGKPTHAILIFRSGTGYHVMDTLAPGGLKDIGNLRTFGKKYPVAGSFIINLVDTAKVRHVRQAKSKAFISNLARSIKQAKKEYTDSLK